MDPAGGKIGIFVFVKKASRFERDPSRGFVFDTRARLLFPHNLSDILDSLQAWPAANGVRPPSEIGWGLVWVASSASEGRYIILLFYILPQRHSTGILVSPAT